MRSKGPRGVYGQLQMLCRRCFRDVAELQALTLPAPGPSLACEELTATQASESTRMPSALVRRSPARTGCGAQITQRSEGNRRWLPNAAMCSTKWLPSEGWGIQENIRKGNIMPKQIKGQNVWNAWGCGHVFHTFQEVANTSKLATSRHLRHLKPHQQQNCVGHMASWQCLPQRVVF